MYERHLGINFSAEKSSFLGHKGSAGPWALFWALKKALKRVNPLKKALLRANPLFWVLKKVFKKVSLIKRALKKVLLWVINSKKCSKKSGLLKRVKFQSFAQKRAHLSWTPPKKCSKEWVALETRRTCLMGQHLCDLPVISDFSHVYRGMRVFVSTALAVLFTLVDSGIDVYM